MNFDNSQSNIKVRCEERSLWLVFVLTNYIHPKRGRFTLSIYYKQSKAYTEDEWNDDLAFFVCLNLTVFINSIVGS